MCDETFSFLGRDIKPENFLVGRTIKMKENLIHSVDFGLAKPYIDSETKRHVAYAEHRSITGLMMLSILCCIILNECFRNCPLHVSTCTSR